MMSKISQTKKSLKGEKSCVCVKAILKQKSQVKSKSFIMKIWTWWVIQGGRIGRTAYQISFSRDEKNSFNLSILGYVAESKHE